MNGRRVLGKSKVSVVRIVYGSLIRIFLEIMSSRLFSYFWYNIKKESYNWRRKDRKKASGWHLYCCTVQKYIHCCIGVMHTVNIDKQTVLWYECTKGTTANDGNFSKCKSTYTAVSFKKFITWYYLNKTLIGENSGSHGCQFADLMIHRPGVLSGFLHSGV